MKIEINNAMIEFQVEVVFFSVFHFGFSGDATISSPLEQIIIANLFFLHYFCFGKQMSAINHVGLLRLFRPPFCRVFQPLSSAIST